jgi:hypothetical protein
LTCLHAGKLACQKKRARQLANWQASQLAPTLNPLSLKKVRVELESEQKKLGNATAGLGGIMDCGN